MGTATVAERPRNVKMDDFSMRPEPQPGALPDALIDAESLPHSLEREVVRSLASYPGLDVTNVVVRRVPGGVCLSGVLESRDADVDVTGLAQQVRGVDVVLNRLLVRTGSSS